MEGWQTKMIFCFTVFILAQAYSEAAIITWDKECGVTKGCYPNCPGGCDYLITWKDTGSAVEFEVNAVSNKDHRYMALGFSDDYRMGDDSVVTCVFRGNFSMHVAYTEDTEYEHIEPEDLGLTVGAIGNDNGILSCSFARAHTESHAHYADLTQKWIMMLAIGEAEEEDDGEIEIEHHHDIPMATAKKVNFQLNQIVEEKKLNGPLVKLHSIMMIIAWILFSTTGIITARYNKEMLHKRTLFGTKVWFQVHRACMVLVLICVIVGFVPIFVEIDGWVQLDPRKDYDFVKLHPILGIVAVAVAVLNPIGGLLRCGPDHKLRWIFNWVHWALGTGAHIIAIVTIFFGFYLERANVPRSTVYVTVVYVAVLAVSVFISEIHRLRAKCGSGSDKSMSNGVTGTSGTFNMQEETTSSRPSIFPMTVFSFTTLTAFGVATILVVLIIVN